MNTVATVILLVLPALLVAYVILQIVVVVRTMILRNRSTAIERSLLNAQIESVMDKEGLAKPKDQPSWSGYRKFEVKRKVMEAENVFSFYLEPHDQKPLPFFSPGQYLTFQVHIRDHILYPGGKRETIKSVVRCYSLSDSPDQTQYYRVTIKKVMPPPDVADARPGLVSSYFAEHVHDGAILDVKAPMGKFILDLKRPTPIVFVGGGIGITPVLSMVNALAASETNREAWLFYGVRNSAEHMMKDHLEDIARKNKNIHVHLCYSDEKPSDGDTHARYTHGRVSVDLFKKRLPSSNYDFYLCGPPPMMNQITSDLKTWGVPRASIFFEAFGPATVKKLIPPKTEQAILQKTKTEIQVTFARSNKVCTWKQGSGSLLELAEQNRIQMQSGCRAGNCGTCLTAIRSGDINYLVEHGAKPESGSCLTCICTPKTDLVLDA